MNFEFNRAATFKAEKIGRENETVIVIDNALRDPLALVDDAAAQRYQSIGPHFPGLRARASAAFHASALEALRPLISAEFELNAHAWALDCFYSIVSHAPEHLAPIQRLPHFDGIEHSRVAAILYLCPPAFNGTAFFRHRTTGFETVTTERFETYRQALEQDVRKGGLPHAAYIGNGEPYFERIAEFDAVFNRMLVYRGVSLHCSAIPHPEKLTDDPRTGRLTMNFFMHQSEKSAQ